MSTFLEKRFISVEVSKVHLDRKPSGGMLDDGGGSWDTGKYGNRDNKGVIFKEKVREKFYDGSNRQVDRFGEDQSCGT